MNKQQKEELLQFLEPLDEKATIYDMTHRFLCFEYNSDRQRKDWIGTKQKPDGAPFEVDLVFNKINLSVPYLTDIKEVKRIIKNIKHED